MEKRDLILRMIEQTAQLLQVVFKSFPLDNSDSEQLFLETTSTLKEAQNLDIEKLILLENQELVTQLEATEGMSIDNIELLAAIFFEYGQTGKVTAIERNLSYQKALLLYQHTATLSATYDFNRQLKIQSIQKLLA